MPASRRGRAMWRPCGRWLSSEGFSIVDVPGEPPVRRRPTGSVAQVEQTFGVNENMYRVDGSVLRAPNADPVVPAAVAPLVSAITGLDGAMTLATPERRHAARLRPPARPSGRARATGASAPRRTSRTRTGRDPLPWLICGYQPAQIDSAYGIDRLHAAGLDGRGQTIAITGAFFSPTIRQDVEHFSHRFHLDHGHGFLFHHHGSAGFDYREIVAPGTRRFPKDPAETQSWYIEQALDVEWAHAVAPRAKIVYVGAANDARGLDLALNYAVDNHLADVISNSWGLPEAFVVARRDPGPERGVPAGRRAGHRRLLRLGRRRRQPRGGRRRARRASPTRARGSPRSAARAWASDRTGSTCGRPAGARRRPTGTTTTGSRRRRARSCTGRAAARATCSRCPPTRPPRCRRRPRCGTASCAASSPTCRWSPTRRRASRSRRPTCFRPASRRIIDSWIGGTSLSAPLLSGIMALADQDAGAPHGFINPTLYLMRGTGGLRDVTGGHASLAVLRNALVPDGSHRDPPAVDRPRQLARHRRPAGTR